jgi:sialate O-acetylesterase
MKFKINALLLLFFCQLSFSQELSLNEIFNDGIVLQQNSRVLVWGNALPLSDVKIEIQGKSFKSKADAKGNWTIALKNLKAGGPYSMTTYSSNDSIRLNEVYVGEVWIAGGQSNMAFMLRNSDNGKEEIAQSTNKNIRFVMVPYKAFEGDKKRGDMNWRTATTENIASISAVAYYFAKELQAKLNVPIGLICCYKGGSGADTWTSRNSLLNKPELAAYVENYEKYISKLNNEDYRALVNKYESDSKTYNDSIKAGKTGLKKPSEPMGEQNYNRPAGLYNTMLKLIIPYTVKGTIWYQGEHNSNRAYLYRSLFPTMIEQWRTDFKNPNMPFLFVQLPSYANADATNRAIWPELREAQLLTWQKVKNTGMAVTIDLGEKNNIHPTNKEPVGKRLSAIAFKNVYGIEIPYSGPVYKSVKYSENKAILSFNFVYNGLIAEGVLNGFTICGSDKKFVPAEAKIVNNKVIVTANGIDKPIAVRYGWANWCEANLKNKEGFMATPFRTDDFELLTNGVKPPNYK